MVFFACDSCGVSVKKNQVEKHLWSCKRSKSLSCIDCNTVFWGDEYKGHIKCISEDQKYGGKDYKPKVSANKGEMKQNSWIETVQSVIDESNIKPHIVHIMQEILKQPNLPRKQAKFENFLKNSLRHQNPQILIDAWDIFSKAQEKFKAQAQAAKAALPKSPVKEEESSTLKPELEETHKGSEGQVQDTKEVNGHSKPKKNKKKKKTVENEEEETIPVVEENLEKDKKRKRKVLENSNEVPEVKATAVDETEASSQDNPTEKNEKRKKRKKQEKRENTLDIGISNETEETFLNSPKLEGITQVDENAVETPDVEEESSVSKKKKKKMKKNKGKKNQLQVIEEEVSPKEIKSNHEDSPVDNKSNNVEEQEGVVKKSKSKKAKITPEDSTVSPKKANMEEEDYFQEEILPKNELKKRKKAKKSHV